MIERKKILITGSAGFIGFHLSRNLLEDGYDIFGIDNLNNYYPVKLKEDRNRILEKYEAYTFKKLDLSDRAGSVVIRNVKAGKTVFGMPAIEVC